MNVPDAILRAMELHLERRDDEALSVLLKAAEEHDDEDLWNEIAYFYTDLGLRRPDARAEKDFAEAQKWVDLPLTRVGIGRLLVRKGEAERAEALFRQALQEDEGLALAHAGMGEVWIRRGKAKEALEALGRALDLARDAHVVLAVVRGLEALGRFDLADQVLGLKAASDDRLLVAQAGSYVRKEDFDTAKRAFHSALDVNPENAEAWRGLAWLAARDEDETGVKQALERARELDPDGTRAWIEKEKLAVPLLAAYAR